jgi:tetratricopeptide (TPR) repeat protein
MAVEELYQKACDAVERANYDYAVELFREVLRQNPEYPDARIALRGTERRRQEERGRSPVGTLLLPPRLALALLKGVIAKGPKKLEACEDFLQSYPSNFWGLCHGAAACAKLGHRGEAIQMYKDALRVKGNSKRALRAIGSVLLEDGQQQEALKYLTHLSNLRPKDRDLQKEVRDLAATEHMTAHDMAGAESFRDLIRDRDEAERLESAGRMAVTVEDIRRQAEQAEKELAEHPDNVNRILGLAQLYQQSGQSAKAQQLLREKHEALPDNYEIREKLGDVQLSMYDEALQKLSKQVQADPEYAEAKKKQGELQARRTEFATKEYTWRIQQHPTDRELQLRLGHANFAAGNLNEAIAAFQVSSQDSRYDVESAKMLGLCFVRKGQHDLALEQFERAAERHPDMDDEGKDLRYNQAQAYEEMGRTSEALDIYKRIYSLDINFRDVAQKVEALSG